VTMTETSTLSEELRSRGRELGADIIGIASIDRFMGLPPEKHPASICPEARSVVVVGKRITRGVLRGVEEGTQFFGYDLFGSYWLNNRVLATATFRVAEFIEDNGWEAIPLPNLPPEIPPMGVPVRDGQPAPDVLLDFDDAAVRAGVGEIGACGLLLTPRFGPRQRIQLIITDAELEPDPLLEQPICLGCEDLSVVCPMNAITGSGVDYSVCASCKNGAKPNPLHPSGKTDRFAALCTRTCVDRLESAGRLKNTFENPFRKRAPWGIIEERRRL
jgi:epoxyqueuosine reductase